MVQTYFPHYPFQTGVAHLVIPVLKILPSFFSLPFPVRLPPSPPPLSMGQRADRGVTLGPQGLPGKKVMGPTPEHTLTLGTHRAAGSFDPVAPARVS